MRIEINDMFFPCVQEKADELVARGDPQDFETLMGMRTALCHVLGFNHELTVYVDNAVTQYIYREEKTA